MVKVMTEPTYEQQVSVVNRAISEAWAHGIDVPITSDDDENMCARITLGAFMEYGMDDLEIYWRSNFVVYGLNVAKVGV